MRDAERVLDVVPNDLEALEQGQVVLITLPSSRAR